MPKLRDLLTTALAKRIGTTIPGRRTLTRHADYPELILKEVSSLSQAVALGGVLIDFGAKGTMVIACQDAAQLRDFDLNLGLLGRITATPGAVVDRSPTTDFMTADLRYSSTTDATPAALPAVVGWTAVATPGNGIGATGDMAGLPPYAFRWSGSNGESLTGDGAGGGSAAEGTVNSSGRAAASGFLFLWRHARLANQLRAVIDEGYVDRYCAQYPEDARTSFRDAFVPELNAVLDTPVGVDVLYSRYVSSAGTPVKKFGLGIKNTGHLRSSTGSADTSAGVWRFARSAVNPGAVDGGAGTIAGDYYVDLGFKVYSAIGKVLGTVNMVEPKVDILSLQTVPQYVTIGKTKLNMKGFYSDLAPMSAPPAMDGTITVSDLPLPSAGKKQIDAITTQEGGRTRRTYADVAWPTLDNVVANCAIRAEARVVEARITHDDTNQLFAVNASSGQSLVNYTFVTPGTKYMNGGAADGLQYDFSSATPPTVARRSGRYAGLDYDVWEIATSLGTQTIASVVSGRRTEFDTPGLRAAYTAVGKTYGKAGTPTLAPTDGALTTVTPEGERRVLAEFKVRA